MKILDILEAKTDTGTYASASFGSDSKKIIADYIKDNDIANPTKTDKLHSTLLYSRAHINGFKAAGKYDPPMECTPMGFEVWETQPDEKTGKTSNALVLKLKCPEFSERHEMLMKKHTEATYDYPEFKVHVTLSYSFGDRDHKDLPEITDKLYLVNETSKPLDLNWAKKNTKK